MKIEQLPTADLIPYARNTRTHSPEQVAQIAGSIREFGFTNPILIDGENGIIAGHGRVMAASKLGLAKVPCIRLSHLTDTQKRAYIIADNKLALNAGWDEEMLGLELADLREVDFDLDLLGFDEAELGDLFAETKDEEETGNPECEENKSGSMAAKFGCPPFSVLNAREGWWQDRKRQWIGIGIKSEVGRGGEAGKAESFASQGKLNAIMGGAPVGAATADSGLMFALSSQPPEVYDKKKAHEAKVGRDVTWKEFYEASPESFHVSGTSIFDPTLTELCYRWFSPANGTIIDPFAGGSVRGIVAAKLGRQYIGHELRAEQVEANRDQALTICEESDAMPVWVIGDSRNIDRTCADVSADMLLTCPPYADLEVYSEDPADLSTLGYEEFRAAYFEIVRKSCALLKPDSFAVCVVGEVRGKDGNYYNFVGDTIRAFVEAGLKYYNEAILVTCVGSLPIRAGRQFSASRKLGKTHQNILVFVKGDGKKASQRCGDCDDAVVLVEVENSDLAEEL
jgi:DNA modification methylase